VCAIIHDNKHLGEFSCYVSEFINGLPRLSLAEGNAQLVPLYVFKSANNTVLRILDSNSDASESLNGYYF